MSAIDKDNKDTHTFSIVKFMSTKHKNMNRYYYSGSESEVEAKTENVYLVIGCTLNYRLLKELILINIIGYEPLKQRPGIFPFHNEGMQE